MFALAPLSTSILGFRQMSPVTCPTHTAPEPLKVEGIARDIQVKIASTRDEWEQAYQMLAANYQARGYETPSTKLIRFTPFHALPDTVTVVAVEAGRVLATLSVVVDNALLGLPLEKIYGDEVAALRREGRRLSEATSLADRDLSLREFIPVFMTIIRLSIQYAAHRGSDTWLITVNPRHSDFYRKVMGFEPLGGRKACPTVRDHPAEAFVLDKARLQANAPKTYPRIFGEQLPEATLDVAPMAPDMVSYFGSQSSQTDSDKVGEILHYVHRSGNPRSWQGA